MNKDTLEELYRKYYIPAMRYVLSLCNNPEIAEDIVSDGFVKAFTVLDDKIPSFQYWLFRVLKNLWIDYLRKNKNIAGESDSEPVSHITPEILHLKNERSIALWQSLDALSSADKEIVVLHYFSSLPLNEVALSMNMSYPAVRQRLKRARDILKKKMEEQGYEF